MGTSRRLGGGVLLAVVVALALAFAFADRASAGGAAFRWKGQVETDISFSEFFANENTIMGRFMVQYPNAYRGPVFGVQLPRCLCAGGPSFELGMGSYTEAGNGAKLVLEVAGNAHFFTVPVPAGVWQHLALRRLNGLGVSVFQLYLNGVHWCADGPGPCDLTLAGFNAVPAGTLALGRTANSTTGNPAGLHQFYGLLDDVAVFSTALTSAQIQSYASLNHVLDGSEPGLYAGYTFDVSPSSPKLTRPVSFTGNAYLNPFVGATANWNSSKLDAKMLPLAAQPYIVRLPFAAGQQWKVIQPYAGATSHYGGSAFALDLQRVPAASTIGSPVYAPLAGDVVAVDDSHDEIGPGSCFKASTGTYTNCNFVQIQVSPGFVLSFRHLGKNSVPYELGDHVPANAQIATVGNHPNGAHLHFGARTDTDDSNPASTNFPLAFKNYKQLNADGLWETVALGVPPEGVTVSGM